MLGIKSAEQIKLEGYIRDRIANPEFLKTQGVELDGALQDKPASAIEAAIEKFAAAIVSTEGSDAKTKLDGMSDEAVCEHIETALAHRKVEIGGRG